MRKPASYNKEKALLTEEMLQEKAELLKIAPIFGREAGEGYTERAKAFNEKCKELGATTMMVIES